MKHSSRLATLWALCGFLAYLLMGDLAAAQERHLSTLGPGDSVVLHILGQPDGPPVYVGDDGKILAPYIGEVDVRGLSPIEAGARISKALQSGGFFVNPQVTVQVLDPNSQKVSVVGEVHSPGRYLIAPSMTVLDVLAEAGGTTDRAGDVGYVTRHKNSGGTEEIAINLTRAAGAVPTGTLQGGDALSVPVAEKVTLTGEVKSPGVYRLEHNMTVIEAVARAGGVTERGSQHRIRVRRKSPDGTTSKVIKPKPTDLVQPDDIIEVKESIF